MEPTLLMLAQVKLLDPFELVQGCVIEELGFFQSDPEARRGGRRDSNTEPVASTHAISTGVQPSLQLHHWAAPGVHS